MVCCDCGMQSKCPKYTGRKYGTIRMRFYEEESRVPFPCVVKRVLQEAFVPDMNYEDKGE